MGKIANFFAEVRAELNKINWPTRQETIQMTAVVIIVTTIMSAYIGSIDFALTKILEKFVK